ncbi:MAG: MAPEG domain-containing protein [Snowella sp.]|jgi:glutathione S-transferase|nr:MAG: MAPEG domain-containing protein [Snowella sp.]
MYLYPSLVTALTLIVYQVLTVNVGRARMKYKIMPPAMSGDENFERVVRVQQNTLEQLVFFLPALWLFSVYVSPLWGAVLGAVWLVGRIIFAWGYYQAAEKRVAGFAISTLSGLGLVLGALVGIGLKFFNIQI